MATPEGRAQVFAKDYFNGGTKYGGYAGQGFADFPNHNVIAKKILAYKPASVLELGCARGYVTKRIQDAGIRANGLEISRHCWLTRACDGIICKDFTQTPWPYKDHEFDLVFSQAVLEHVPENLLPAVIREMSRVAKRCVHGIDFGVGDDGFDRTHVTLRGKIWWDAAFAQHWTPCGEGEPRVTVLDKEELQAGEFPPEVLHGDGKMKLNLGSHFQMFHHGWENLDRVMEWEPFAKERGYKYKLVDITSGLPYGTGAVSLICLSHVLEHFDYPTGARLLAECRRVLDPATGLIRVAVPDAQLLMTCYGSDTESIGEWGGSGFRGSLSDFDEVNDGCAAEDTPLMKLDALLNEGHKSTYDEQTLCLALTRAGFKAHPQGFRKSLSAQMLREATDTFACLSLYAEGTPDVA